MSNGFNTAYIGIEVAVVAFVVLAIATAGIIRRVRVSSSRKVLPSQKPPISFEKAVAEYRREEIQMTSNTAYDAVPPKHSTHNSNSVSLTTNSAYGIASSLTLGENNDAVYSEIQDPSDNAYSYIPANELGQV